MNGFAPAGMLCRHCILTGVEADSVAELMQLLARPLSRETGIEKALIADRLIHRERVGSTGFGGGSAVPHARFPGLDRCVGSFALLARPIDFAALDGEPVDIVYVLLSPEKDGADHLKALAAISRLLRDETLLTRLRGARDADAAAALLSQHGWSEAA